MRVARQVKGLALTVAVAFLVGCLGGGGGGSGGSGGSSSSPPPSPSPDPPPGSSGGSGGIPGVTPGTPAMNLQLNSSASSKYSLYVPPGYNQSTPIGLVIAFHGVEPPTNFFQVCVYYANNDRFIVLAPHGDQSDGGYGAWSQPWTKEIWDYVRSRYNIANAKQYVVALSGGCYPAIWFALASSPATYTNYLGQTVKCGFQSEFAAVGFTAPAYSPSSGFSGMSGKTAAELGFTPACWVDYGETSSDGPKATDIKNWCVARGYNPVTLKVRTGEGHSPQYPFSYLKQCFDMFEANPKP